MTKKRFGQASNVIELENVSLSYRKPNERFRSFKEFTIQKIKGNIETNVFWALRDINFVVRRGEVLGLIGHNGAGKSTLLQIVARILRPSEGKVIVRGSVAPLLGVGAGFHQELSGRENIFLNGSLLGFTQKEMEEKFDSIVQFAEIGDFIDSPVRTYSSGMRTRLGFAIATDSTPDILLIDEVLSVGDKDFREKSSERMRSYFDEGATILLVSHSLPTILELCDRVVWLHHGKIKMIGGTRKVIKAYRDNKTR